MAVPMLENDCHPWLMWPVTLIFTFSLILSLVYYYKSSLGDPGYLPANLEKPQHPQLPAEAYRDECKECKDKWRPPRAYHCSVCNKCVFKVPSCHQLEHHYLLLNNCVGVRNLKSFLLFLVFTCQACLIFSGLGFLVALNMAEVYGDKILFKFEKGTKIEKVVLVMITVFVFLTLVLAYCAYDSFDNLMYGVDRNQTTVENYKEIFGVKVDASITQVRQS
jgi:hypothetical protein